uniref:A-kinase anchor protein 2 C-terminal domain-containing protein n=1 Tax=Anopheles farauti TaxID=69004 RepID=A0A182QGM7_9DIPT
MVVFDRCRRWYIVEIGSDCNGDKLQLEASARWLEKESSNCIDQEIACPSLLTSNMQRNCLQQQQQQQQQVEDPLKRIQEEINEVTRREQELREGHRADTNGDRNGLNDLNDDNLSTGNSDDSGLSLSPTPVHSPSVSNLKDKLEQNGKDEEQQRRPYTILPNPKVLTRARSTPQLFHTSTPPRRFNPNPNQRGIMQKFIAARGRLSKLAANGGGQMGPGANVPQTMSTIASTKADPIVPSVDLNRSHLMILPTAISTPPAIERDSNGKPIRRGYVPVEEKIQRELRDLKTRECELKRIRKLNRNASQSDLLDMSYDAFESNEELSDGDSTDEPIYPLANKLRSTKSISELCDALTNSSLSPRETPSPLFESRSRGIGNGCGGGMRPAMSLAQLCDLDPQEAPSSHKLIAQWESLIQQKQQR